MLFQAAWFWRPIRLQCFPLVSSFVICLFISFILIFYYLYFFLLNYEFYLSNLFTVYVIFFCLVFALHCVYLHLTLTFFIFVSLNLSIFSVIVLDFNNLKEFIISREDKIHSYFFSFSFFFFFFTLLFLT